MISEADILGATILIVDDQPDNITLMENMLRGAGYTGVTSTIAPHTVCDLHATHHYDLIVLDVEMPGMDGFQVMEGLKQIEVGSYLSVLVMTAEKDHKLHALQSGAKDFVSKPFDLDEVLMRVHNMLEVRLLHQAALTYGKALESLALRDPLTGLANRRLVSERMPIVLAHARRNRKSMAVLGLDLDGFKAVNDTYGHAAGDLLLKVVADRLVATVRDEDTVARMGGDEFVIALWYVLGKDEAALVAQSVIDAVSQPFDIDGQTVRVTVSVGISLYPTDGEDAETLLKSADAALYRAKHAGKNACRFSERMTAEPGSGHNGVISFGASRRP